MTKTKKQIPKFKSIEEESEFWDTHSITDYLREMKPTEVRFAKNLKHILKKPATQTVLVLPKNLLFRIKLEANKRNVSYKAFIKMKLYDVVFGNSRAY